MSRCVSTGVARKSWRGGGVRSALLHVPTGRFEGVLGRVCRSQAALSGASVVRYRSIGPGRGKSVGWICIVCKRRG